MKLFRIAILLIFSQLNLAGQDLAPDLDISQFPDFRAWELIPPDARQDYIAKWRRTAIDEMLRAGVPASISMAQGIVESNAGQSSLVKEAKNHFGIKCGGEWKGKSYYLQDDDHDESGNSVQSCFRKYKHEDDSWIDHSDFLRDPKKYNRYGFLFNLDQKDYRSWAYGLKSAGYATGGGYAESLINVIETHRLYELDNEAVSGSGGMATGGKPGKPGTTSPLPGRGIGTVNDVKVVLAKRDETIDDVAKRLHVKTTKLVGFNDNQYQPTDRLRENSRVFIQKKRNKWRGRQKVAYVKDNQLIFDVAQQYGIKLEKLRKRNRLVPGEEPAPGETLKIRGWFKRPSKPRLRSNDEIVKIESNRPPATGSGNTAPRPTTGSLPTKPSSGKPKADERPQNPYTDELPFEIGDDKTTTDKQPSSQPGSGQSGSQPGSSLPTPVERPKTSQPPIATSGADFPSPDRAKPSTSTGTAPSSQPPVTTPPPVSRPGSATPSRPSTSTSGDVPGATYHEVVKGDTLYNISKRYGTTPAAIQKLNGLPDNGIQIGQRLRVK